MFHEMMRHFIPRNASDRMACMEEIQRPTQARIEKEFREKIQEWTRRVREYEFVLARCKVRSR